MSWWGRRLWAWKDSIKMTLYNSRCTKLFGSGYKFVKNQSELKSPKALLPYKRNILPSVPLAHAAMKKTYENMWMRHSKQKKPLS